MPAGNGDFRLHLNGIVRRASGTKVGDHLNVEVAFDEEYRSGPTDPMPYDLRRGLKVNGVAAAAWRSLPPSRQKEILRYLNRLKSPESRVRNVRLALEVLGGANRRFLGREWNPPDDTVQSRRRQRSAAPN